MVERSLKRVPFQDELLRAIKSSKTRLKMTHVNSVAYLQLCEPSEIYWEGCQEIISQIQPQQTSEPSDE